jgi:actin-like ATPase involved in cell morphogenesis
MFAAVGSNHLANVLVYVRGRALCSRPSVVAVSNGQRCRRSWRAQAMLGRAREHHGDRPMRDGVIADYIITEAMAVLHSTGDGAGSSGPT